MSAKPLIIGTGKTTTARKMGQIFYDMGFLASRDVLECSATDLIGQYVGQTGPKTTSQLEKALGKVLFIDEAYRLGEGNFATEAINELVDNLTKPKFAGKMIVILAGYEDAMDQLLGVNQGLASRFPEDVIFRNMEPQHCLKLLERNLQKSGIGVDIVDVGQHQPAPLLLFERLSSFKSWGNGRDVNTLSKSIAGSVFQKAEISEKELTVTYKELVVYLETALSEKKAREPPRTVGSIPTVQNNKQAMSDLLRAPPPQTKTDSSAETTGATSVMEPLPTPVASVEHASTAHGEASRDPGVSDDIWSQLQADKAAEEDKHQQRLQQISDLEKSAKAAQAASAALDQQIATLAAQKAKDEDEANELKRLHEQARLERLAALRAKQEAEEAWRKAREEEERKRKEAKVQAKLRDLGVCVAGFRWIKQAEGYRCGGGSHFIGNGQLGI